MRSYSSSRAHRRLGSCTFLLAGASPRRLAAYGEPARGRRMRGCGVSISCVATTLFGIAWWSHMIVNRHVPRVLLQLASTCTSSHRVPQRVQPAAVRTVRWDEGRGRHVRREDPRRPVVEGHGRRVQMPSRGRRPQVCPAWTTQTAEPQDVHGVRDMAKEASTGAPSYSWIGRRAGVGTVVPALIDVAAWASPSWTPSIPCRMRSWIYVRVCAWRCARCSSSMLTRLVRPAPAGTLVSRSRVFRRKPMRPSGVLQGGESGQLLTWRFISWWSTRAAV